MQRHGVELLRTVLLLMREKSREVVKSVIGFIKVAVSALPQEQLKVELRHIVQALLLWAGESKNRFRLKIKARDDFPPCLRVKFCTIFCPS